MSSKSSKEPNYLQPSPLIQARQMSPHCPQQSNPMDFENLKLEEQSKDRAQPQYKDIFVKEIRLLEYGLS